MTRDQSIVIASKLDDSMRRLDELVEYLRETLEPAERAPFMRAIGEIFALVSDEMKSRLVLANPDLHDALFRGLPKDYPAAPLKMSRFAPAKPKSE